MARLRSGEKIKPYHQTDNEFAQTYLSTTCPCSKSSLSQAQVQVSKPMLVQGFQSTHAPEVPQVTVMTPLEPLKHLAQVVQFLLSLHWNLRKHGLHERPGTLECLISE